MVNERLTVRPATEADEEAIWRLLKPVFRAGETYAIPRDICRDAALAYWFGGHSVFVTGAPIAGTSFVCANARGGGGHVANAAFVTDPAARGRGIASALLDHAVDFARREGYRAMQFNFVVATNTGAIRLWERAGFAIVGRLPGAFRHPEHGFTDALVMMKSLEEPT